MVSQDADPNPSGQGGAPAETSAPLSAGQQRIWFSQQLMEGGTAYNELMGVRLTGELHVAALAEALRNLVARHGSLRTVFREVDGELRQLVRTTAEIDFELVDRTGSPERAAIQQIVAVESGRRFDLTEGPLLVTRLVRLSDRSHLLLLSMHHIIVDALSAVVLARDLAALYRSALTGDPVDLPAVERDYADFARQETQRFSTPKAKRDLAYWVGQLGGEPRALNLPTDRPRPEVMTSNGRALFRSFPPELTANLHKLAQRHRSTLFMTLVTGIATMLGRAGRTEEVIIGTPVADRPEHSQEVVGFFLNTLALRIDLSGDPTFTEALARVRAVSLDAFDHAGVPFEHVVKALEPPRVTDRTPVFQVLVEFENDAQSWPDMPGLTAEPLDCAADRTVTDLTFYLKKRAEGLVCQVDYSTDLFDESTAEGLVSLLQAILQHAVGAPDSPLSRLAPGDGAVEPEGVHGPRVEIQGRTVHERVEEQAARRPDAIAVDAPDGVLTYAELIGRASVVAGRMRTHGVRPGDVVALWLPRQADLIAAMLAVLQCGAAYLPLDPSLGTQRVDTVLDESRSRFMLAHRGAHRPTAGVTVLEIPVDPDGPAQRPEPSFPGSRDDACYVIYTSGSTGRPKGVVGTHGGVLNLCGWHHRRFGFDASGRAAMVCSQSFDASVLEIWPTLTAGGRVVIAPDECRLDSLALARWYRRHAVTFSILPTQLGGELLTLPDTAQPPLRHLLLGGEEMRRRPRPGLPYEVVNVYGPTETTVLVTTETVADSAAEDMPVALGLPIDGTDLYVLDEQGRDVPPGAVGELYVGGAGVAAGYLNRPDLTGERFVDRSAAGGPAGRLYRTGDLVRRSPDGRLEFRGRVDDQVKIRGYRVEPGEIAHTLRSFDEVADAVVISRRDDHGDAYLIAYVVPDGPHDRTAPDFLDRLRERLAARLPDFLVPRHWALLDTLPLNGNGKIDRSALPDPGHASGPPVVSAPAIRPDSPRATPPAHPADVRAVDPGDARAADQVEHTLRRLWSDQLGLLPERIATGRSFFDLGGHSINAVRLLNRVRETFGSDYSMADFYREPTIDAMAARTRAGGSPDDGDITTPERVTGTV